MMVAMMVALLANSLAVRMEEQYHVPPAYL
jgi:hypothetical protein